MSDVFVHPQALNDCESVGSGTRIWAFAHVMQGARVGRQCNLGEHTFVETGAVVGDGVTVKNNVSVWSGVTLEDHVFVGPAAVFTNDRAPRSHPDFRSGPAGWEKTRVCYGASIGANATLLCGITLGRWCLVAAGSPRTSRRTHSSLAIPRSRSRGRASAGADYRRLCCATAHSATGWTKAYCSKARIEQWRLACRAASNCAS